RRPGRRAARRRGGAVREVEAGADGVHGASGVHLVSVPRRAVLGTGAPSAVRFATSPGGTHGAPGPSPPRPRRGPLPVRPGARRSPPPHRGAGRRGGAPRRGRRVGGARAGRGG